MKLCLPTLFLSLPLAALSATPRPAADLPWPHDTHTSYPLATEQANDVRTLAVDPTDRVWAATRQGLFVLDPAQGTTWHAIAGEAVGWPAFDVTTDAAGTVWLAAGNGLHRIEHDRTVAVQGIEGPLSALAATPDGIVAGGPKGFFRIRPDRVEHLDLDCTRYLHRIATGPDGSIWFATAMGLYHLQHQGGHFVRPDFDRISADVRALAFDPQGQLWAACLGGAQVYRGERLSRLSTPKDGLPSADVRAVAIAPDSRVWLGTARGITRLDGRSWSVRHGRRWLLDDDVRDLAFDSRGAAWIATGHGVSCLRQTRLTLAEKADHFRRMLEARHIRPPGIVEKCRLRVPGDLSTWAPTDDDNDGGYTAVYLAMESYRYAVTREPAAIEAARRAFSALEFLQRVTGTPGFLARTVVPADWKNVHDPNTVHSDPDWSEEQVGDPRHKRVPVRWRLSADGQWLWKGDTSSDEMTAHFYGYFAYHERAADETDRQRVRDQVCRLTDHLIDHGFLLTDLDGQPTRWGVWAPDRLNRDPDWAMERGVNSVELLSFLKLASHVSGDPKYEAHYRRLLDEHRYDRNVLEAPNLNPAWRTYIDFELLAFAYPALLQLEKDPRLLRAYRRSFERWHEAIRNDGNPFFEFLYGALAKPQRANLTGAMAFLRDTPLDLVRWTADNSRREDVSLARFPEMEKHQTARLLPPSEIGYSRTDQNPWLAVQGDGGHTESDGVFWLLPYWMGRYHGFVAAPLSAVLPSNGSVRRPRNSPPRRTPGTRSGSGVKN